MTVRRTILIASILVALAIVAVPILAAQGEVVVTANGNIPPLEGGLYRVGPSWGYPAPFTITQSFVVPNQGLDVVNGTIAWGPCQNAIFLGASPGYTSGGYPTPACSWIQWSAPFPKVVTVSVRYEGGWDSGYIGMVSWYTRKGITTTAYCLLGEPVGTSCPASLYIQAQVRRYLPIILKGAR